MTISFSKSAEQHSLIRTLFAAAVIGAVSILVAGCARPGLIAEEYDESFYRMPSPPLGDTAGTNPVFIVYGDTQASWLAYEKFANKSSWVSWKMLAVPFYQAYLLAGGIIGGVDYIRHKPDLGRKERMMMQDAVWEEAGRSHADFILNLGDMAANDGRRPDHWALFLKENMQKRALLRKTPYLPVPGNHDRTNDSVYGAANYKAIFDHELFYEIEFKDAALFVVNSNYILDQNQELDDAYQDSLFQKWFVSEPGAPRKAWLQRKLSSCSKSFKIVAMHHPPLPFGHHHNDWSEEKNGNGLKEKRKRLIELFEKEGVQVVFSGHEHFYQHCVLKNKTRNNSNRDIHFIVSSGGGAYLREVCTPAGAGWLEDQFEKQGLNVKLAKQARVYHYTVVKVSSSALEIKTIEVSGELDEPLKLLDTLVIKRPMAMEENTR